MGVNLVTIVRNFYIRRETFGANDHDVQDGCVTVGAHRVLRFDFLSHNAGDADLVVGSPAARPDLFVWSAAHGHYHLKDFNEFKMYNTSSSTWNESTLWQSRTVSSKAATRIRVYLGVGPISIARGCHASTS